MVWQGRIASFLYESTVASNKTIHPHKKLSNSDNIFSKIRSNTIEDKELYFKYLFKK